MPDNPVIQAANEFRAALLKRERATATRMVNAYGQIYANLQGQIDALTAEIAAMDKPTPGKVRRLARYKALLSQVEAEVSRYGAWADTELQTAARIAIRDGMAHAEQLTLAGVPQPLRPAVAVLWNRLPAEAVETLMGFLSPGSPLHQALVAQLGPAVAAAVEEQLLNGIALGYNPRRTAAIMRRTLGQGLTWSLRTARTAQLYAYREATRASYVANSDVVEGWIWHAQLDSRTCMSCISMHGTEHSNDEVLNDHHNGRCAMVPKTVSWRDLGFDIDDVPLGVKEGDGRRWFEDQSEATQRAMFGNNALYKAWQEGAVSWDQLSRDKHDTVYGPMRSVPSLKELLGEDAKQYYAKR